VFLEVWQAVGHRYPDEALHFLKKVTSYFLDERHSLHPGMGLVQFFLQPHKLMLYLVRHPFY